MKDFNNYNNFLIKLCFLQQIDWWECILFLRAIFSFLFNEKFIFPKIGFYRLVGSALIGNFFMIPSYLKLEILTKMN